MSLTIADLQDGPAVDGWLRFSPSVAARHEAETGDTRIAELRRAIYFGLVFYNIYNFTSMVLSPDIFWLGVAARVGVVTPTSLVLAYLIGRVGPVWRERLVVNGMIGAILTPIFLFWLSRAPLSSYMFAEIPLSLVFGNMVLPLRFRDAALFSAVSCAAAFVAVLTKSALDGALTPAFLIQFATATAFTLFANYQTERLRCAHYLATLAAVLRSEAAEGSARILSDISDTDALTGLPNRRHLDRWLDEAFARPGAIAVMMLDIDHFKLFNDALGHPAGDECLRAVAGVLSGLKARGDCFVARYGGEEFTIALSPVDALEAARVAASVVKGLEAVQIPHPARNDGLGVVTASVGVALRPDGSTASRSQALKWADEALYEAKRRGRNRYVFANARPAPVRAQA